MPTGEVVAVDAVRGRATYMSGSLVPDTFATFPSFRPIRVLESGALANLASYGTTLPELLASFDVVDRIDAVGSRLVLTQGRYNPERPIPPLEVLHSLLEVYDRHTGTRLYEDVPLPDGSRVLGGGRFLYLLLDMHAPPWRIAKLRFRVQD